MKKLVLLIALLSGTMALNAQSNQTIWNSYFWLLNTQESATDIRVFSRFPSADNVPPPLAGYMDQVLSDTLFIRVLYKQRFSSGSGSSVNRDDTFYNVAIPASVNYLNVSGNMLQIDSNGDVTDTSWNETDSTFVLHPVGINNVSKNVPHIAVHPNPANNTLFFEHGLEYRQVQLYNSVGQRVASYPYNNTGSIDISVLAGGFYFLKLNGKKEETLGWARFVKTE
jgi:hypothetical protein